MIDILRIIGGKETVVCTVPEDNASVVSEIMGREEVNIDVTVDSPLDIRVGDFVRVDGTVYTLNREAGMEKRSDVEYRYDLVFESPLYRLLDKLFTHPVTGVSTFTVSRTLKEFVKIVVDCINTIDPGWTVSPGIPDTDPVNLTFEGISCREALNRLSDGFGMEFCISGREIHFVRDMENATGLVFEQGRGKGLYTVTQEPVDTGDIVTRVYPYGGTTNVFPADGDVNGRLYLPEKYLEDLTGYGKVVEREVVFDDIFPCLKASVDAVSGEYNGVITCGAIDFDINTYGIGGVKAKINFLSGDLMGESFAFTYTHAGKQISLIRKEDMTALPDSGGKRPLVPHDLRKARAGDRFNLTDIYVPDEYKARAIVELRARAADYLTYYSRPRVKFTLEVDHRYLRDRRVLKAGDVVTVKIPETGMEKPLRVNSVERNLKTGRMSCVVSNYLDEKWEKRIEGELTNIRSSVSGDISDIRGEVSNVSRPSSLWYPDKLKEYFRLNEDGTITMLENPLRVKGDIYSEGDQVAFANTSDITEVFAIASPTNYGLVKIDGSTVKVNASGQLYTDVAGLDETALKKYLDDKSYITSGYLTTNKYVTEDYIRNGKYITLSSLLDGYAKPATYTAIAATDTLLSAFGKLDRRFDDYVDRTTAQTVGGIKTFTEDIRASKNIISDGDQIAFGSMTDITEVFAVAGTTNYGLVKYDGVTIKKNADNQLYADIDTGGISGIKPATGSGNVITSLSLSADGRYITPDKGLTALTPADAGAFIKKAGDTMAGKLYLGDNNAFINGSGFFLRTNNDRVEARGMYHRNLDDSYNMGVGFLTAGNGTTYTSGRVFIGWGGTPWDLGASLSVAENVFKYKNVDVALVTSTVASATKLQTARTINGTSFDGTANIVTNTWGAERPFSIASHDMSNEGAAVKVNGFSSYVLPLPSTIKATLLGNASSSTVATKLQTARKLWGQTFAGDGDVKGTLYDVDNIILGNGNSVYFKDSKGTIRSSLTLNTADLLAMGYETALAGYNTLICGASMISFSFKVSDVSTKSMFALTSDGRFGVNNLNPSATVDIVSTSNVPLEVTTSYAGISHLFTGKNSKNATRFSIIENNSSVHLQYGGNTPVHDIHRFAIQGTDGARLMKFDVAAKESVFSGDMAVGGNIKSDGDQVAFANTSDITEVFAIAGTTNYGLVKIDGSTIKIGSDGRLYSEGGGSFGNIAFIGGGPFLSDVTPSADKKTLTFTRVAKPTYTVSEITNAVSTTDSRLTNARPASDVYAWAKAASKPAYTYSEVGAAQSNQSPNVNLDTVNGIGIMCNPANANATTANKYPIAEAGTLFYGTAAYGSANQIYGTFSTNRWFARGGGGSPAAKTAWKEFAFLTSNVASATNADMVDGYHVDRLMTMDNRGPGNIIPDNTIVSGYGFGYSSDGWPTTGSYINFSGLNNMYPVQIQGAYQNTILYVRTRNGDNGSWNPLHQIMTSQGDLLTSSNSLRLNSTLNASGLITGSNGLYLIGLSANSSSHIRLVNNANGVQWGIKAGNYQRNENDLTITSDSDSLYPSLVLQRNSSSYGKMKLVSLQTSECSIGYVNNNSTFEYPSWVVGVNTGGTAGIFGWYAGAVGTNIMALHGSDGLYLYRGWLRTSEDTGWFNSKWGGGIYMNEDGWVKIFNKPLMCPYQRYSGCNGFGVNLVIGGAGTGNCGVEWEGSDNIFGIGLHQDDHVYFWKSISADHYSSTGKTYSGDINLANNQFSWYGLLLTSDDQVAFSDMRLKTKADDYAIDIRDFVGAPLFTYYKKGSEKDGLRVGTSAQWMLNHMRLCVYGSEKDYYSYSYSRGGFILGVSIIKRMVPWMDEKDKKIEELERRIHILESRQAS